MRLSATSLSVMSAGAPARTLWDFVREQLLRRGDSLLLPGTGAINGFEAGTYSDSTGTTPAVRDDPLGRWVDAGFGGLVFTQDATADKPMLSRRLNLLESTQDFTSSAWLKSPGASVNPGNSIIFTGEYQAVYQIHPHPAPIGTTVVFGVDICGAGNVRLFIARASGPVYEETLQFVELSSLPTRHYVSHTVVNDGQVGLIAGVSSYSGVTATSVIINQAQLNYGASPRRYQRVNAPTDYDAQGFPWRVSFDGTDTMSASIAQGQGYDNCTIIDATPAGQVMLTGQNIEGAYTIGPNLTTHGRIIARGALTSAELALYQQFASKLAGL